MSQSAAHRSRRPNVRRRTLRATSPRSSFQFKRTRDQVGVAAQRAQDVASAGELQYVDHLLVRAHIIDASREGLSRRVLIIVREQRAGPGSAEQEFFQRDFVVTGRESDALTLVLGRVI